MMYKELKAAIITWLLDNENAWQRVTECKKHFRPYIFDAAGQYLIGGEDASNFIDAADKLLYPCRLP